MALRDFRFGVIATESVREIQQVFGEESLSVRTAQNWFVKDNHAEELQPAIDSDRMKQLVEQNLTTTVRKLAEEFRVPKSTIHNHLKITRPMQTKNIVWK
ncbi:hypothetical protein Trydic_g9555 [Trypoxylus dichotomus]